MPVLSGRENFQYRKPVWCTKTSVAEGDRVVSESVEYHHVETELVEGRLPVTHEVEPPAVESDSAENEPVTQAVESHHDETEAAAEQIEEVDDTEPVAEQIEEVDEIEAAAEQEVDETEAVAEQIEEVDETEAAAQKIQEDVGETEAVAEQIQEDVLQDDESHHDETEAVASHSGTTSPKLVSAADLSPLPQSTARSRNVRSTNSRDGVAVLTSSPYLEKLKLRAKQKETKTKPPKSKRTLLPVQPTPTRKRQKTSASGSRKRRRSDGCSATTVNIQDNNDPNCVYCDEKFSASRAREVWVMCQECSRWAHTECAGISTTDANFTCDLCID